MAKFMTLATVALSHFMAKRKPEYILKVGYYPRINTLAMLQRSDG
jgi:hypothetical protein